MWKPPSFRIFCNQGEGEGRVSYTELEKKREACEGHASLCSEIVSGCYKTVKNKGKKKKQG
jgi:hypothetical protein